MGNVNGLRIPIGRNYGITRTLILKTLPEDLSSGLSRSAEKKKKINDFCPV